MFLFTRKVETQSLVEATGIGQTLANQLQSLVIIILILLEAFIRINGEPLRRQRSLKSTLQFSGIREHVG